MSFQSRWQQANQGRHGGGEEWDALRKAYPAISDVLLGCEAKDGQDGRPRCKILIFTEADKLKFMLSPVVGSLVAFGTFPDPTGGFEALEAELAEGRFEWKNRRR